MWAYLQVITRMNHTLRWEMMLHVWYRYFPLIMKPHSCRSKSHQAQLKKERTRVRTPSWNGWAAPLHLKTTELQHRVEYGCCTIDHMLDEQKTNEINFRPECDGCDTLQSSATDAKVFFAALRMKQKKLECILQYQMTATLTSCPFHGPAQSICVARRIPWRTRLYLRNLRCGVHTYCTARSQGDM